MSLTTFNPGDKIKSSEVNDNFAFNFDDINTNTKIFCELLNNGDINESSISKIISNSGLTSTTNNPTIAWADKLTDFGSFVKFNNNINQTNNGIIELAYLTTTGNLIAGRFDLLNDTFTQTHNISSSDLPVATGDSTYNSSQVTLEKIFMLTESNTLIYGLITKWRNTAPSPDEEALFVDAKVYDSSGNIIQTYSEQKATATSGNSSNRISSYGILGFYTSGDVAKTLTPITIQENDSGSEDVEYHNLLITYDSTFSTTFTSYIYYASDEGADVNINSLVILNDDLYIRYYGREDDGGSTDEYSVEGYLLKYDLSTFTKTIVNSFSDYSCESPGYSAYVMGDMIYTVGTQEQNGGDEEYDQHLYIDGNLVYSANESDDDVDVYSTWLQLPEGYEVNIYMNVNNTTVHSIYKAYNRINDTSDNISAFSTIGSSSLNGVQNKNIYIFKETDNTKHFADISTTGYRVYDKTTGEVNFYDDVTDTYMNKSFTYYTPYINSFWSNLINNITTNITVNNGVNNTVLNANKWVSYNDTVKEIYLTINCDIGPIEGNGNLSYYMLYN